VHLRVPSRAAGKSKINRKSVGEGVILLAKKENCGCGCVPPGKTSKPNAKTEKAKATKKPAK
jgi:hypothetical protein